MTAELVRAVGKPAFVLFMGGPQRAPTTYRDARELIEGSDGVAGMGVDVEPDMLTQRAIYHHSTAPGKRSEEHTSELQSLMRISYAVFCLKKKSSQTAQNKTYDTTTP